MRTLETIFLVCMLSSSALAVDYRWSSEVNRGTTTASVTNGNGSIFDIYCAGANDGIAGMGIQTKRITATTDTLYVQILVDGNNHPFVLTNLGYTAEGRLAYAALAALVDALADSKKKTFTVEFPKYKFAETFSLLDAKKILGGGKMSMLTTCDPR